MCRREEIQTFFIEVTSRNGNLYQINHSFCTYASIKFKIAKLVVHHRIKCMNLAAIVEWRMQVVLPNKLFLVTVPILNIVFTMLAIGRVEIATFKITRWAIMVAISSREVTVPMVFLLIATSTFVTLATQIEHITLCIFQRIPIIAKTADGR